MPDIKYIYFLGGYRQCGKCLRWISPPQGHQEEHFAICRHKARWWERLLYA